MVNFGPIRVIVLGSAKLIKECFQNPIFNGRPSEWSALILTNGRNGLLTTEGPVWEEQRRFTSRALRTFGFGKRSMESLVMREVGEFLNWLKSNEGKSVTLRDRFELAVVNALWSIIASKRFQHDDSDKLQLLRNLYKSVQKSTPHFTLIVDSNQLPHV
ncbi:unnamed protein product [Allacma fusca]|uniref:Cytochrome P450 n=1 Tax=Allacma fusca TaxID=39272 RepID=A0A8J2LFD4_9HEXA|nr:unnamed protein product [Allacma fusca]